MAWIWATSGSSALAALASTMELGHIGFINGGGDSELWGRTYEAIPGVEELAAAEFIATAHACVSGLRNGKTVTVIGDGVLADLIRSALPGGTSIGSDVVIDTTGSPDRIEHAVATLPKLGQLILAAPPGTAQIDLATYRDLHVRALTVTGVPWVSNPHNGTVSSVAIQAAINSLAHATPGHPPQQSAWYAVHNGGTR
jgi:threonine dehydrogenase-like Zn-dependent dehydrogenase